MNENQNNNEELRIEVGTDDWDLAFFNAYDKGMNKLWDSVANHKTAGVRTFVIISEEEQFDEDGEVIDIYENHFNVKVDTEKCGLTTIHRSTPGFTAYEEPVYEVDHGDIKKFMETMSVSWDRDTLFF